VDWHAKPKRIMRAFDSRANLVKISVRPDTGSRRTPDGGGHSALEHVFFAVPPVVVVAARTGTPERLKEERRALFPRFNGATANGRCSAAGFRPAALFTILPSNYFVVEPRFSVFCV
jgi:hypothetical protein